MSFLILLKIIALDLLNRITNQYTTIAKLSDSAPGIVTGANNKDMIYAREFLLILPKYIPQTLRIIFDCMRA